MSVLLNAMHSNVYSSIVSMFLYFFAFAYSIVMFRRGLSPGTKTVLFGYHQFLIHPIIVGLAWWRLFGFPWDPRLWVAFFVHDIGYFGKPNLDLTEGEKHPEVGAAIIHALFDFDKIEVTTLTDWCPDIIDDYKAEGWRITGQTEDVVRLQRRVKGDKWRDLVLLHSRFYSRKLGLKHSKLCVADKFAILIAPRWLQLGLMNLSGEIGEYLQSNQNGRTEGAGKTQREWFEAMRIVIRQWVRDNHPELAWAL